MCEKATSNMTIKNSPAVKKPFRSLFNNNDVTPERTKRANLTHRDYVKSQVENTKRQLPEEQVSIKKICFDVETDTESVEFDESVQIFQNDLEELQESIKKKKKEIEVLKNEILYCKKNKCDDLEADIKRWRTACQDVLERLHKDLKDKRGQAITMEEILSSLGIPNNLVHYSAESDTFT